MANRTTAAELVRSISRLHRVITLGGFAVIAHGQSRPTYDADVWLDSELPIDAWCSALAKLASADARLCYVEIGTWRAITLQEIQPVIERDGVIRLMGADQPLDIFRKPNELEISSFSEVWQRASVLKDGSRLPDLIDLLVTKQLTGRAKDQSDIFFLEQKAEAECMARLSTNSAEANRDMLDRFLTPNLAAAAARHADASVREAGLRYLKELAAEGDPFAEDLLRDL